MKKVGMLVLLTLLQPVSAGEDGEWVLYFRSWSNWGEKVEMWLNSSGRFAVGDGSYWENIPCNLEPKPERLKETDSTIQELISLNPKTSDNAHSSSCSDEPRVNIRIALEPERHSQRILREYFSLNRQCNNNEIHEKWYVLATQLERLGEEMLERCRNSPFQGALR